MRDPGLSEAIRALDGVSELAPRAGISKPAITSSDRVPTERVLTVEAAAGVSRIPERPDLYREPSTTAAIDEIDFARAQEYALLSTLLAHAPDARLLTRLARLDGDDSALGVAHRALANAAAIAVPSSVEREYFNLFVGVGRGELMPYGSYYLTGFLYERPLARLRRDLEELGVERVEDNAEPEDHAATLCEIMAAVVSGQFAAPKEIEKKLFEKHLAPWIGRFLRDLESASGAEFYRAVGGVGRVFVEIETEAFALPG